MITKGLPNYTRHDNVIIIKEDRLPHVPLDTSVPVWPFLEMDNVYHNLNQVWLTG